MRREKEKKINSETILSLIFIFILLLSFVCLQCSFQSLSFFFVAFHLMFYILSVGWVRPTLHLSVRPSVCPSVRSSFHLSVLATYAGTDIQESVIPSCNPLFCPHTVQDHIFTKKHLDNIRKQVQQQTETEREYLNPAAMNQLLQNQHVAALVASESRLKNK